MFNKHGVMGMIAEVVSLCRWTRFLRAAGEGGGRRLLHSAALVVVSAGAEFAAAGCEEGAALWPGDRIVFSRWLEGLEFNIAYNSFGDIVLAVDETIDASCSLFIGN